ncbi:von Willebrand factor C domain-containing protein 2-like [Pomacea canaliculata]|uniref:von Willebrand factor C domain-containing protein 2-like n=1 Tax=Pomacea canaliculata TaxID=400727 RepID=UPI000D72929E|nr:von Willebrand factor C domain-containing protein 2-like [Pomacea canaliculata]
MTAALVPPLTVGDFRWLSYGSHDEDEEDVGVLSGFDTDNTIPDGFCKTWIGTLVAVNATWEENHCRKCRCDVMMGAVCQNPQCAITFHPYLETNCEEWSSDSCCCIRSACVHEGKHYAADDWFVLTYDDPCTLCQCNPSDGLPSCVLTKCPSLGCVDAKKVPGLCCPVCTSGLNCAIPSLPLLDGEYDLTPLPVSTWRLFNASDDSPAKQNCTCSNPGGPADCTSAERNSTETSMDKGGNLSTI